MYFLLLFREGFEEFIGCVAMVFLQNSDAFVRFLDAFDSERDLTVVHEDLTADLRSFYHVLIVDRAEQVVAENFVVEDDPVFLAFPQEHLRLDERSDSCERTFEHAGYRQLHAELFLENVSMQADSGEEVR